MNSARPDPVSRAGTTPAVPSYDRIAFVASPIPEAQEALQRLNAEYGNASPETADVIVALGGDGFMLQSLHKFMHSGMPIYGISWHERDRPPTSEELAAAWGDDIRFAIDAFGPSRCMFESNFPVDRRSCSYTVLWNAFKRIAAGYSPEEKQWLFHDAAATAYRLPPTA